jgi:hypothetical protein
VYGASSAAVEKRFAEAADRPHPGMAVAAAAQMRLQDAVHLQSIAVDTILHLMKGGILVLVLFNACLKAQAPTGNHTGAPRWHYDRKPQSTR